VRAGIIGRADRLAPRLTAAGLEPAVARPGTSSYQELADLLDHPRLFLLDLDPGAEVDRLVDEAYTAMEPGDVVVDLTGSYWGDTLRRYRRMRHRSLFYLDAASIDGPGSEPVLLVAGDARGVDLARPLLERLAEGTGARLLHAGEAGAAHYALMVHDAWRTALTHAASEVHQALEAFPNGTASPELPGALTGGLGDGHGPRAAWLLDDAVRLEAATPLLAQAVMLEVATALDEFRACPPPARVGPFVHPDEIL
jgi:3-hydroxyisobutyrate dehydrogenase-like beta-hydroxyacid dehydrogenase